jgi:hypothetical protein
VISVLVALAGALACNFTACGEIWAPSVAISGETVGFWEKFLTDFFLGGGARVSYVAGEVKENGGKQNG